MVLLRCVVVLNLGVWSGVVNVLTELFCIFVNQLTLWYIMIKTRWIKRDAAWIAENKGKPTMYKEEYEDGIIEELKVDSSREKKEVLINVVERLPLKKRKGTKDAGIYGIICEVNRSIYIGQSMNIGSRLRNHKMIIANNYKSEMNVYKDIRKDYIEFGDDSFKFVAIKEMPEATNEELLNAETELMIEYLENGWMLYNRDNCNNTYISPAIRPMILNLVLAIKDKPELLNTIKALID